MTYYTFRAMKLLHYLVIHKHAKISDKSSTSFKDSTAVCWQSFSQPVGQLIFFDKLCAREASAHTALMMPQKITAYFAPLGKNKHGSEGYFQVHELHETAVLPKKPQQNSVGIGR